MDKGKLYPSVSLKDQMDLIKTALNQNIVNKSFANLAESHKNLATEISVKELKQSNQALEKAPRYIVNNIIRHEQLNNSPGIMNINVPQAALESVKTLELSPELNDLKSERRLFGGNNRDDSSLAGNKPISTNRAKQP